MSKLALFGPKSMRASNWWREPLSNFGNNQKSFDKRLLQSYLLELPLADLRPDKFEFTLGNTSSGYPWMVRADKVRDEIVDLSNAILRNPSGDLNLPFVLGLRSVAKSQTTSKSRVIWMESKPYSLISRMYLQPILRQLVNHRSFMTYGNIEVMHNWFKALKVHLRPAVGLDQSQFDARISITLYEIVEEYILALYQPEERPILKLLFQRMRETSLITPDGTFARSSGVPSGHGFTNLIDSLVSYMVGRYCQTQLELGGNLFVMGDDTCFTNILRLPRANELVDVYEEFGLVLNPKKQSISSDYFVFLNKLYCPLGVGIRSVCDGLNSVLSLERPKVLNKYEWAVRALSQLEECRQHQQFRQLVAYVYHIDKYRLGFRIPDGNSIMERLKLGRKGFPYVDGVVSRESGRPMVSWSVVEYCTLLTDGA